MDKIDVSKAESLWLNGVTIGVLARSNHSVAYPVVGIIQSALFFCLDGLFTVSFDSNLQEFS